MGKFKKTILNSVTSLISVFINSIFSLVLGRLVIQYLGSDYNGVNATATQILTILTLIEGGLTTASIVSLFEPFVNEDYKIMNQILSTSSKMFKRIAILTLGIGIIIAITYTFIIKSSLDNIIIFIVFLLSISSTCFNLYFVNTYRIMFQVSQNEYILNLIVVIANIITQICSIFVIIYTKNIILVRFVYFIFSIIQGVILIFVAKKTYSFIDINNYYEPKLIKGTRDVVISKFTSVIYSSATIMFLSSFVGTTITSIYAIYNNVVNIIKNCLYSIINAPQNAIGQLLASNNKNKITNIFNEYEYIVLIVTLLLMSITYIMIIPFVIMYTGDIADINYVDYYLPILIIGIAALELIHIPSGITILMSGEFRTSRIIQTITCILLIIFNLIGALFWGLYGLLIGTLIVNIILALMEIIYARKYVLKSSMIRYLKVYFPITLITFMLTFHISNYVWYIQCDLGSFFIVASIIALLDGVVMIILSFLFNKEETISILKRIDFKNVFNKYQK